MPNWVFNYLEVTAKSRKPITKADKAMTPDEFGRVSDLPALIESVRTQEGDEVLPFDFETIIPTPPELYAVEKIYYADPAKKQEQAELEARMTKLYGSATAYDFHCDKWGTKWNACEGELDSIIRRFDKSSPAWGQGISVSPKEHSCVFRFQTAWSPPAPVILALSLKWPKMKFELDCEEEANMFNPFTATFKDGREVSYVEREPEQEDEGDE